MVDDVHSMLKRIKEFSSMVRSGDVKGFSGANLKNLVVIGIGGSYLGIEFLHEALVLI